MFRKDKERFDPEFDDSLQKQPTGLLNRFASIFKSRYQETLESNRTQNFLSEDRILDFWFQKQTYVNGLPSFTISNQEKQLAIRDVSQFMQTPALYKSQTLVFSYKIVLSDLNCLQIILNSYPDFFATIPKSLILDQQFIVSLATHSPDVLLIWSMSLFENFSPIKLYDSIHNSLSSDWVVLQHYRDSRVVVMKTGMVRKTIDLLDLWLLNLNWIAEHSQNSKSFNIIQDKFFNLEFEPEVIQPGLQQANAPLQTQSNIQSSKKITESFYTQVNICNPLLGSKDDTHPNKGREVQQSINHLVYLNDCLIGKKCILNHPNYGRLDIIITGISDRDMEFVIIAGQHLGRNSQVPKDIISSCLIVGNENSRILNTNIIQVKK